MDSQEIRSRLLVQARAEIEQAWGLALTDVPATGLAVLPATRAGAPLAVRVGDGGLLLAEPQWLPSWNGLAASLTVEQLFSIYGVFELARATLPDGVSPFGPVWAFLADRLSFSPARHEAVEELDKDLL